MQDEWSIDGGIVLEDAGLKARRYITFAKFDSAARVCGVSRIPLHCFVLQVDAALTVCFPGNSEGMAEEPQNIVPAYEDEDEYRPEPTLPPAPPAWKDGSTRVGIHTSIAGDIAGALDIAHGLGANALQIFSSSPRMWSRDRDSSRIQAADAARFRERREALGLGPLVIHDNYLINLGVAGSRASRAICAGISWRTRAGSGAGRGFSGGASRSLLRIDDARGNFSDR